tara:strand:+ start:307 stop:429 length:123 start_codon:yes stop_codon:yes gene_type:complete
MINSSKKINYGKNDLMSGFHFVELKTPEMIFDINKIAIWK